MDAPEVALLSINLELLQTTVEPSLSPKAPPSLVA